MIEYMEALEYLNTNIEEIESRKHNILIPICLGNKFFSNKNEITDNVRKYTEWALSHTKDKVLIIVVDKIQDTNYYVRSSGSKSRAASLRRVLKDGQEIKRNVLSMINISFSESERGKIDVICYEDYEKADPTCTEITQKVSVQFNNDEDFRTSVLGAVKFSVNDREFSEEEYLTLCKYVLDEFALVYSGIEYDGKYYGLYVYPETDAVVDLVVSIQQGNSFIELNKSLPTRQIGLVILNENKVRKNAVAQRFFDDFANAYEDLTRFMGYSLFDLTKSIYKKYGIDSGTILDAGCGTGKLKLVLGNDYDYTGVDFSKNMLSVAESRGYKIIQGYLEDVVSTIENKSYDHVVCLSVFYFIKDAEPVIKKLQKIARKSLTMGFEKYTQKQLDLVFNGYEGVKRYNHPSSLVENPTEVLKNVLFWTYADGGKIYGDFVFKKLNEK
jgi:tRNA-dependent cyclodipeptide synthase